LRNFYGDPDSTLAAAFFAGSGIFQTSLAPLYTLRRFAWIIGVALGATLITGITFVGFFHRSIDVPWEPATLAVEIALVGLVVMAFTLRWMRARVRDLGGNADLVPPATGAILRAALPYGVFGACYFLMIVADHFGAGLAHGFPFVYRSGYELGCDIGLLAIVPVVGILNVALEGLPRRILGGAKDIIGGALPFDRAMLRFYLRSVLGVLCAVALTILIAEFAGAWVIQKTILGVGGAAGEEALFVLRFATVGYGVLMLGLLNCQLLLFLSRHRPAVAAAIAGAATVTAGSALVVALHAPARMCVFALDAGIVVFLAVTTVAAAAAMRRFTYNYYAAY
jgi:hypothetical protein